MIKEEFKLMARNYDEFCSEWQLNCGAIAWISLTMIIISLATMITAIILAVKTYNLNKRVNRLYEYMDAKATKKEQEEDDNQWKKRITNPNKTHNDYTPNPTRNNAKIDENYNELNNIINRTKQALLDRYGINITDAQINQPGEQRDPNLLYQNQGATSPLLG